MRVLLVDDEPELVFTMAERLEMRGHVVDAVTSGADALERIRTHSYDVAVVDVKMPGLSGEAVLHEVRRDRPELPVILLTGHSAVDEAEAEMGLGACACLFKPIDIETLIEAMKECADGRTDG